jgi:hypothetical protein
MHHHCIADFEHSAPYWIPCFTIPEGYISTCQDLDSSAILHVITYLSNGRFRAQTVVQTSGTCEIPTFYQQVYSLHQSSMKLEAHKKNLKILPTFCYFVFVYPSDILTSIVHPVLHKRNGKSPHLKFVSI